MNTNVGLLIVAGLLMAAAIWWTLSGATAAAPPTVLALIMLAQGVGGPVWTWAKWSEGAGLPPWVTVAPFTESLGVPAFLWAAIGASVAALIIPRQPASIRGTIWKPSKSISIGVIILAAFNLVGFLIGEGPSFFHREVYLQSDGPEAILRIFWPLGVLFGLIALALTVVETDRKLRMGLIIAAGAWFIGPLAVGSRTALAIPAVGAALIAYHEITKRRLHLPMIAAALALLGLTVFTFSVILNARVYPHGLLEIPALAQRTISDALVSTDSYLRPLKQLSSSIFASVPNAERSVTYGVPLEVLAANANPLPGVAQPMELERYWPYEWVPLSFAGTWFGATGGLGQFLLYFGIGWVCGYTMFNIQRSPFALVSFAPIGLSAIIGVLSIQYSSRMVWRVISITVLLLIMSVLTRKTAEREALEAKENREHEADDSDASSSDAVLVGHSPASAS